MKRDRLDERTNVVSSIIEKANSNASKLIDGLRGEKCHNIFSSYHVENNTIYWCLRVEHMENRLSYLALDELALTLKIVWEHISGKTNKQIRTYWPGVTSISFLSHVLTSRTDYRDSRSFHHLFDSCLNNIGVVEAEITKSLPLFNKNVYRNTQRSTHVATEF